LLISCFRSGVRCVGLYWRGSAQRYIWFSGMPIYLGDPQPLFRVSILARYVCLEKLAHVGCLDNRLTVRSVEPSRQASFLLSSLASQQSGKSAELYKFFRQRANLLAHKQETFDGSMRTITVEFITSSSARPPSSPTLIMYAPRTWHFSIPMSGGRQKGKNEDLFSHGCSNSRPELARLFHRDMVTCYV
jgi:hypothetical protein